MELLPLHGQKKQIKKMIDDILTYLVEILYLMVQSYWGALFSFLFGIYFIRVSIKEKEITSNNLRGWAAGIGGVIVALLILFFKLTDKT